MHIMQVYGTTQADTSKPPTKLANIMLCAIYTHLHSSTGVMWVNIVFVFCGF